MIKLFIIFPIKIYQYFISPLLGNNCRFIPTCSEYAIQIYRDRGFLKGTPLVIKRLLKCHPFTSPDYDPIPMNKNSEKTEKLVDVKINEVRKIRKKILYPEIDNSYIFYDEDKKANSKHFGLDVNNKLVSVLSLFEKKNIHKKEFVSLQLRGMATISKFQNSGYGSRLLEMVIQKLKNETCYELVWCNSRLNAKKFYINNGFTEIGDDFTIESIGKHKMLYIKL